MSFVPPAPVPGLAPRRYLPESEFRGAVAEIAARHGLFPCELEPYAKGESVVWRAGDHVIKVTVPACSYQIDAEVGCLSAVAGKLSVQTPALLARGELSGWPYVVMRRIGGRPLAEVWPGLDHNARLGLARELARLARELHALPASGFPGGWDAFFRTCRQNAGTRHAAAGVPPQLLAEVAPFLERVGPLAETPLVPLHTELLDQHVYLEIEPSSGRPMLSGLIDFADARLGPAPYEIPGLVEFVFRGEAGLLREFCIAYGMPAASLTGDYSETLLAWSLSHRFGNLARLLTLVAPVLPRSLGELACLLFRVED